MIKIVLVIWAALCLLDLVLCMLDKFFAVRKMWRIPERVLLGLALVGGAEGLLLGMVLFHHKISKPAFRFTVPFMVLLHLALCLYFCRKTLGL